MPADGEEKTPPLRWVWSLPTRAACLGAGLAAEKHARQLGWWHIQAAELSLVVVELTTNALRHGRDGACLLTLAPGEARVLVYDSGPGIPQWVLDCHVAAKPIEGAGPQALRPHGLGAGLDVVRRLSTTLALSNDGPGGGARAEALLIKRSPPAR